MCARVCVCAHVCIICINIYISMFAYEFIHKDLAETQYYDHTPHLYRPTDALQRHQTKDNTVQYTVVCGRAEQSSLAECQGRSSHFTWVTCAWKSSFVTMATVHNQHQ